MVFFINPPPVRIVFMRTPKVNEDFHLDDLLLRKAREIPKRLLGRRD
jgi:hypothetical protein